MQISNDAKIEKHEEISCEIIDLIMLIVNYRRT